MASVRGLSVKVEVKGLNKLLKKLRELEPKVARKAMKEGVQAGGKVFLDGMKQRVAVETKTLLKSLGKRQKSYKRGKVFTYFVGVRTKMGRSVTVPGKSKPQFRSPTKYAHLVEFGAPEANVRAQPFIRPAFDEGKAAAIAAVESRLKAAIASA